MTRGLSSALPNRRLPTWCCVVLVALVVAGGCSDDDDGDDSSPPIATVHGVEISESDVEELASDAGFLAFIGAPEPEDGEDDLSQTEAGRRTLTWLIGKALIDTELTVQELEVDDGAVDDAADDLDAGDVPDDVNAIVDSEEEMGDDATEAVAEALAAYETLDEWLRTIDPADAVLQDRILTEHPEATDRICGSAVAVDEPVAATVREQLAAGAALGQIADAVETVSRTPPGGECLTRGQYPRQLVDLLYGTPVGSAGEKTIVSRSTGQNVVFFVTPVIVDEATGDDVDVAVTATLQRLHDEGGGGFSELAYSTVDPKLDDSWGVWDPTVGVVEAGAAPTFSAFDLPDPTTTTAAPTTTAPPPPPPVPETSEFVDGAEATLAGSGSGDPGTGDLVARAQAALESAVPSAWRQALPVQISVVNGSTSLSWDDGRIEVGSVHASGEWNKLMAVMAHELGHQVAYHYGSQAEFGVGPEGWPPSGSPVQEGWADCVSGSYIAHYPCGGSSQGWTIDWLAPGPGAHPRTG